MVINAAENNSHGCGLARLDGDRIVVKKGMWTPEKFADIYEEERAKGGKMIIHARIATQGTKTEDNCHPFWISNKDQGDPLDVVLFHNGHISDAPDWDKQMSDTANFAVLLSGLLKGQPSLIDSPIFDHVIETYIGRSNKVVLFDSRGTVRIFNRSQGYMLGKTDADLKDPGFSFDNNIWVSNLHSLKAPYKYVPSHEAYVPKGNGAVESEARKGTSIVSYGTGGYGSRGEYLRGRDLADDLEPTYTGKYMVDTNMLVIEKIEWGSSATFRSYQQLSKEIVFSRGATKLEQAEINRRKFNENSKLVYLLPKEEDALVREMNKANEAALRKAKKEAKQQVLIQEEIESVMKSDDKWDWKSWGEETRAMETGNVLQMAATKIVKAAVKEREARAIRRDQRPLVTKDLIGMSFDQVLKLAQAAPERLADWMISIKVNSDTKITKEEVVDSLKKSPHNAVAMVMHYIRKEA